MSQSTSAIRKRWNSKFFSKRNLLKFGILKMENYSENSRRQSVKASEPVNNKKNSTGVTKKSITKKLHQPFTHTKKFREGQIPRSIATIAGNSHLNVQNFLWRYNNREKASWIR